MITDNLTNAVFFSDLLPKRCPKLYESLHEILQDKGIDHRLVSNTKDIWCRDYMPIQADGKHFVFYKYNPDYLQTPYYKRRITDVNRIEKIDCLRQKKWTDLDLVIDGGNVVKCDDKIIMTEKVLPKIRTKNAMTSFVFLKRRFSVTLFSFHGTAMSDLDIVMASYIILAIIWY